MQNSNGSMQLLGLCGPMLSSHEVILGGKLIHVVMPSDDYRLIVFSFSLFAAAHKLCIFSRPLSVSAAHHRPQPVAGDHEYRRRVRGPMWPGPTLCYQLLKWTEFHFISIIQIHPKNKRMHWWARVSEAKT